MLTSSPPLRPPRGCRLSCGAALALVLAFAPGCASDSAETRAVKLMQDGIDVGRAGDLDAAAALLEESATTRPGFVDPLMFLANVHEHRGDLDAARAAYQRALQADPTFTRAGVALALTYVREQRFAEARLWLDRCIDMDPGSEPALFNLGALAERAGETSAAIEWYRLAGSMHVWATGPVVREGRLHLAEGRIDAAGRAAERAIARDPEDPAVIQFVEAVRAAKNQ